MRNQHEPITSIVVGVDGSNESIEALRWAGSLAAELSATLHAHHCWTLPATSAFMSPQDIIALASAKGERASSLVSKAIAEAGIVDPVEIHIEHESPGEALTAHTGPGVLLVLGRTGGGVGLSPRRLNELVLGSTARYCVAHARGPVAIVPEGSSRDAPVEITVGLDGSSQSHEALRWTATAFPSSHIQALLAFTPWITDPMIPINDSYADMALDYANRNLDQWIEDAACDRSISRVVAKADPRRALTRHGPELVVVGTHGRAGLARVFLGSVSDHVVRHAPCPVIVVPEFD